MKKIGVVKSLVLSVCDTNQQGLFLAFPNGNQIDPVTFLLDL